MRGKRSIHGNGCGANLVEADANRKEAPVMQGVTVNAAGALANGE